MSALLANFFRKFLLDILKEIWFSIAGVLTENKKLKAVIAAQEVELKKYKESVASDKPHDQKVEDAEDFLNGHKP